MDLRKRFNRIQMLLLITGFVAAAGAIAGAVLDLQQFYRAYLVAYLYWTGLSLGCLGWLLLHNLTGGNWGFAVQRTLAAGARTLPLMAVLFLPLLLGFSFLYPWAGEQAQAGETLLLSRNGYLNVPFFLLRTALYFAVWIVLALFVTRWSYHNDERGDPALWERTLRLSAVGLALFVVTANFAAFDWLMSLEPEWFSLIFGWLAIGRHALGAIALAVVLLTLLWQHEPLRTLMTPEVVNDLGNVLLATLLAWAYLALMQYLVIWSANLPAEVTWYERRTAGLWEWVVVAMTLIYAAVTITLLLPRTKRRLPLLAALAALILATRLVHVYWLVVPVFEAGLSFYWLAIVLAVAIGGLWLGVFVGQLKRHPLLPVNHPRLAQTLADAQQESHETI